MGPIVSIKAGPNQVVKRIWHGVAVVPRNQRNMKRPKSIHGNGALALTPDVPRSDNSTCPRCRDKQQYIDRLLAQIERQSKVLRDQTEEIAKKQHFFDKLKMALADQSKTLLPGATTRPARKGKL